MALGTLSFIVGGVIIGLALFIPLMWFIFWIGKRRVKKKIGKYFDDLNKKREEAESKLDLMITGC